MDERGQFTFYRSFWEAVKGLPKKDRLPIYEAIISYALDGATPSGLSPTQNAVFLLTKPNLDASRKKAASGKQGGSKPKANGKQNAIKKEKEEEKENEIEKEGEKEKKQGDSELMESFSFFWVAYPKQIGESEAADAWEKVAASADVVQQIMVGLDGWKKSEQWRESGGRFIPHAARFLTEGYWMSPPAVQQFGKWEPGEAEREAIRRMVEQEA